MSWASVALAFFLSGIGLRVGGINVVADVAFGACYAAGVWGPGLAGRQALRRRSLDVDLLMIVVALVAAGIGQVLDGSLLIEIFLTSGALEAVSTKRGREAVTSLVSLAPQQTSRFGPDGDEAVVVAEDLVVEDRIFVRPGAKPARPRRARSCSSIGSSSDTRSAWSAPPSPSSWSPCRWAGRSSRHSSGR